MMEPDVQEPTLTTEVVIAGVQHVMEEQTKTKKGIVK